MRPKAFSVFVFCVFLVGTLATSSFAEDHQTAPLSLDVPSLDVLYLDVRYYYERRTGYIANSMHIPLFELQSRIGSLSAWKDKEIVTVCASGDRSAKAAAILQNAGFLHVKSLEGGMGTWNQQGKPVANRLLRPDIQDLFSKNNLGVLVCKLDTPPPRLPVIGLRVEVIFPDSPAERAGIEYGDTIITVNDNRLMAEDLQSKNSYHEFFPTLAEAKQIKLIVARKERAFEMTLTFDDKRPRPMEQLVRKNSISQAIDQSLSQPDSAALYDPLERAFKTHLAQWGPLTLPIVYYTLANLRDVSGVDDDVVPRGRSQTAQAVLQSALETTSQLFSNDKSVTLLTPPIDESPAALVAYVEAVLERADKEMSKAAASLSSQETEFLKSEALKFIESYSQSIFIHDIRADDDLRDVFILRKYASRVELGHTVRAAQQLSALTNPKFILALKHLAKTNFKTTKFPTRFGPIVIGGQGPDSYSSQFAAIIDLGGNDSYHFSPETAPLVIIDLSGDDHYAFSEISQSEAIPFHARLLYDLQGNDVYEGKLLSLGSALLGASILIDESGNDEYRSTKFSQGAAIFGVGIFIDSQGNDRYLSEGFSQGFGGVRGVGMLLDTAGNDFYQTLSSGLLDCADCSFSQGAAAGIRFFAPGGIGVLVDLAGNDRYEAREYAQGIGYTGGLGILSDYFGNDSYHGHLFVQGAGVHGGIGILADSSGNDSYKTDQSRGQGVGWDLGVGYLKDEAGDDTYAAAGESQGFSAENGFSVFYDEKGQDNVSCANPTFCQGKTGDNSYANGRKAKSIALFLRSSVKK